jgi:tetratricopeptide (TPR) repeat protein
MGTPRKPEFLIAVLKCGLYILLGMNMIFGQQQSHPKALSQEDRHRILLDQENRAQRQAEDPGIMKSLSDRYPSRSQKTLELYIKGSWLCEINGHPDSDDAAPTKELRALAYDKGVEYLRQAIQLDPSFPVLYLTLGEYLIGKSIRLSSEHHADESQKVEEAALEAYQKARDLEPSNPAAYFGIARTTPRSNLDERIRNLLIVEKLDSQYPAIHDFLAAAYEMKGNLEKASEENIYAFNEPGEMSEVVDRLARLAQKLKQYSWLLEGYLEYVDREPRPKSFDDVLFAVSPYRPKRVWEKESLNLQSLIDRKVLADFVVKVGAKAVEKQEKEVISPEQETFRKMIEKRDPTQAAQMQQADLSHWAEQFFKKAMDLDSSQAATIRKIAESSRSEELKKFARELPH